MKKYKINVIGLGYIGLPTALMLAVEGLQVIGTDNDEKKIKELLSGNTQFDEKGLESIYKKALKREIFFSKEVESADIYIVAVPTPYDENNKTLDPSFVIRAVKGVLKKCKENGVIAIESTISPGTIDKYIRPLLPTESKIQLAHVPERIIPGNMIWEMKHVARVIGVDSRETGEILKFVYSSFCKGDFWLTDIKTAEMVKVAENTYRDINIAYANELAKICRKAEINVYDVIEIANKHPRVNILSPGPGVGGHCIAVDPWFLVGDYHDIANIILSAREVNDSMPEYVLNRVQKLMEEYRIISFDRVGFYGLTYKENINDIRNSPTLQLSKVMGARFAEKPFFYDPYIKTPIIEQQVFLFEEFLMKVDMIVIMVAHSEIIEKKEMIEGKVVFDTKNVIDGTRVYHL